MALLETLASSQDGALVYGLELLSQLRELCPRCADELEAETDLSPHQWLATCRQVLEKHRKTRCFLTL